MLLKYRAFYKWHFAESHEELLALLKDESVEAVRAEYTGIGVEGFQQQIREVLEGNDHIKGFELNGNVLRENSIYPISRGIMKSK